MTNIRISNWRFIAFLMAQFLGAFNDNALKLVVSMASLSLITDAAKQQGYLAMTSALAILPFILFSGYAGYFADRYAKSNVLRISKGAEILAMLAVLIIFMTDQPLTHLLVGLFLLATHSSFFSPSKYSILPEILHGEALPKANGYLNMLTFAAIILGSMTGATLWGMFKNAPTIIGFILLMIAVVGTCLCLFVPQSPAGNKAKPFRVNPFSEIIRGVSIARQEPLLLVCMMGTATFWLLGGLIYLSVILLGKTQLGLSEAASGSLFAFLASGIALGSVAAGYLIARVHSRVLMLIGAMGLSVGCMLTGVFATSYMHTAVLMGMIGLGGGLLIVPIVTLLQKHAPEAVRGQVLATSGFFDMFGVLMASGMFWLLGTKLALSAAMTIFVAGCISLVATLLAVLLLRRHLAR